MSVEFFRRFEYTKVEKVRVPQELRTAFGLDVEKSIVERSVNSPRMKLTIDRVYITATARGC